MSSTKEAILSEYESNEELYKYTATRISQIIESLLSKENIKVATITNRVKSSDSLADKIIRKEGKYKKISDITDIVGIRIIAYYADDVDRIANLLESEFDIDWDNSIDRRKTLEPNTFGYLSLHYVVQLNEKRRILPEYSKIEGTKAEIQIRSILQHAWAEMEHDTGYKTQIEVPKEVIRDFSRLAGLLEIADKEFMEIRDKINAYRSEVEKKIQINNNNNNDDEIKLDIVSLEVLLKTDKEFMDFNRKFESCTGIRIDTNMGIISSTMSLLVWHNIYTVKELREMLRQDGELALRLGENCLKNKNYDNLSCSVGVFYLCYARLIHNYPKEQWIEYLEDNAIGKDDERNSFVEKLFRISQQNT